MTKGIVIWGNVGIALWVVNAVAFASDVGFLSWDEVVIVVVLPSNRGIAIGSFSGTLVGVVVKFVSNVAVVVIVVVSCWFSRQNVSANKASLSFLSSLSPVASSLKS